MSKLIITEKNSVAQNIADALGITEKQNGYMEGNGFIISWCVGHLVELAQPASYGEVYEKWTYDSLPILPKNWNYEVKKDTKKQFDILVSLMNRNDVTSLVCATDAGREGELIFRLVYKMSGCRKPFERLWISSMEEKAIREGFSQLRPGTDYDDLYNSALCRQQADWLVGINGTRLFTVLYRSKVLKVGRVQTPTLAMIVNRESEIMNFKKEPYYTIELQMGNMVATSGKCKDREEAQALMNKCCDEAFVSSCESVEKVKNPPMLYDLNTLQIDANRWFGYTAKKTLELAQSLYEKKLMTYPRTDSKYLTEDMEDTAKELAQVIVSKYDFVSPFEKDLSPDVKTVLNSKKVTDHHAIIPTMEITKDIDITDEERNILELVACRVLCATGDKHVYISDTAVINCNDVEFKLSGTHIKDNGWKAFEDGFKIANGIVEDDERNKENSFEGTELKIAQGEILKVTNIEIKEGFTKPPVRYTEATLLAAMEKAGAKEMDNDVERKGLGTPATRAEIIDKIIRDGYVKREKKKLIPTDDGIKLITVLPDVVKSPQLTADWENQLVLISKGKASRIDFMNGIENMVSDIVQTYHSVSDDSRANLFKPAQESYGNCPKCGKPVFKGKFGFYCSGKCGMTLGRAMGATLTDQEVKDLLDNKKIYVKGLKNKAGKIYNAYLTPKGIEQYSFRDKDGNDRFGWQYQFEISFPKKQSE
ncbi:MAG: DNA topoisomerase 3 [Lachnospiraceae bacterium]|nr:DNA topoisomerase 3 [Lachnospiraceae bacterium]